MAYQQSEMENAAINAKIAYQTGGLVGRAYANGPSTAPPPPRATTSGAVQEIISQLRRTIQAQDRSRTRLTGPFPEDTSMDNKLGEPSLMEALEIAVRLANRVAENADQLADSL